jgi:nucleotide-binding universal stress UspA family protein
MEVLASTYGSSNSNWIKRIVVAADGSPASILGLEQVAELAPRMGAKVVVVFVRHFPATVMMGNGDGDLSLMQAMNEIESEVRQRVMRLVGTTGVAWEYVVRVGSPGEEIAKVAEETGADLIVVGSNRHSSLHDLLLGSTAAYLATHSPSSVLVMRSRSAAISSVGDPDVSMALVPPSQSTLPRWEMTESSPQGSARRQSEVSRGVPIGGKSS